MNAIGEIEWNDGVLWTGSPGCAKRVWMRPVDLAEARLATDPAIASLALADGRDLLTAAFAVVPFVRGPFPEPSFGESVTEAARAAFKLFLGRAGAGDSFRVLRGELDDFLVCARRTGATWRVGAFTVKATTLTLRFEDVWSLTPPELRFTSYSVDVLRDDGNTVLSDVVPDARICVDLADNGGFLMTFTPTSEAA